METKCSNCSGPVFIPLDRGVTNCKNCGKLAGRYCPECNIAMPKPTKFCSGCGLSYGDSQKRALKIAWEQNGSKLIITMFIMAGILIGFWLFSSGLLKGTKGQSGIQFVTSEVSLVPRAALNPEIVAEGKDFNELRITWKNTGTTNIHCVKADIELFDNQGQIIEKKNNYIVYAAEGRAIAPGENPPPDAAPGIAPGNTYTDPPSEGFMLFTTLNAGFEVVVPTNARVTALYVVD